MVGLVNASHETTTNLIGNTILALLRNPDQWQKLRAEPRLVPNAVEEGLRYESPVQMLGREAAEDVAVGGIPVSKGEHVMVLIGAANRDPAVFPDPDRFDVTRDEYRPPGLRRRAALLPGCGPGPAGGAAGGGDPGPRITPPAPGRGQGGLAAVSGVPRVAEPGGDVLRVNYFLQAAGLVPAG